MGRVGCVQGRTLSPTEKESHLDLKQGQAGLKTLAEIYKLYVGKQAYDQLPFQENKKRWFPLLFFFFFLVK